MATGWKTREKRWPVLVAAEVRADNGWIGARIHNVSTRGLLIAADGGLTGGSYVEIRSRGLQVVGRVAWCDGRFAGLRLRERIDILPLIGQPAEAEAAVASGRRLCAEAAGARALERTRRLATLFRWTVAATALVAGSATVAQAVVTIFAEPLEEVGRAMEGGH